MFARYLVGVVATSLVLAVPAEALGLGGLGGKGRKSSGASSSGSSSSSSGGVSAGGSIGRGGISAGARAGGISAGASVGRSGISAGASVGDADLGASVSRSGVSTSVSVGGLDAGASVNTSASSAQQPAALSAMPAAAAVSALLLPLPLALRPNDGGETRTCGIEDASCRGQKLQEGRAALNSKDEGRPLRGNLPEQRGTPAPIVAACQTAAAKAAAVYGAVSIAATSAGKTTATGNGGVMAPVNIRITYPGRGGGFARQARVSCSVNGNGIVTALA